MQVLKARMPYCEALVCPGVNSHFFLDRSLKTMTQSDKKLHILNQDWYHILKCLVRLDSFFMINYFYLENCVLREKILYSKNRGRKVGHIGKKRNRRMAYEFLFSLMEQNT